VGRHGAGQDDVERRPGVALGHDHLAGTRRSGLQGAGQLQQGGGGDWAEEEQGRGQGVQAQQVVITAEGGPGERTQSAGSGQVGGTLAKGGPMWLWRGPRRVEAWGRRREGAAGIKVQRLPLLKSMTQQGGEGAPAGPSTFGTEVWRARQRGTHDGCVCSSTTGPPSLGGSPCRSDLMWSACSAMASMAQ
jgi:hypothetical protein